MIFNKIRAQIKSLERRKWNRPSDIDLQRGNSGFVDTQSCQSPSFTEIEPLKRSPSDRSIDRISKSTQSQ